MRVKYKFSSRRTRTIDPHNQHRQKYPSLAREVIMASDIILQVLDARFLEETRNNELEKFIKEKKKSIIYVINKVDLIDIKNLINSEKLDKLKPYALVSTKDFVGKKKLREMLKIRADKIRKKPREDREETEILKRQKFGVGRKKHLKTGEEVHIGVIGYPNVGKSSLINMLVGKASARTSMKAGFTKGIQKIKLAKDIIILDTPGVINPEEQNTESVYLKKHSKLGVRDYNSVKEPDFVIAELMKENPTLIEKHYDIDADGDSELLLEKMGRRLGYLKKGNKVDIDRTAKKILKDWQEGKIR